MAEAHLVGSVNLTDPEAVFRTAAAHAGGSLRRLPDGERGRRAGWITVQPQFLGAHPQLEVVRELPAYGGSVPRFGLRAGAAADDLLVDLPYAEDGIASYKLFASLVAEGVIPAGTRFQVSIPTAMATTVAFIDDGFQGVLLPRVEASLAEQVRRLTDAIPVGDLAIQWDVAAEFNVLEARMGALTSFGFDELFAGAARLGDLVPAGVQLGYHLCYGDAPSEPGAKGQHFVEPRDTGLLVDAANRLTAGAGRPIDFMHLPVPIDRTDEAYFAPLARLALDSATRLYLGLVHEEDGLDGAQTRIAAASRFVSGFGVATECGLQNEPRDAIPRILQIQHDAIVPAGENR